MKRIDYIICFLLGITALVSRIPFLEKFQSFWDGPQYTIGIIRFSFVEQTPAAPGYPFFIGLGKLFHVFIQDLHTSIVAVSVFAGILGAITLYIVGLKMFNRYVGFAATIIFLTGSTFYFFSIAPHTYDLLITTTTLLAYSVYRIFVQKKQEGFFLGLIIGICIGLRPQEIIQLGLLFLLGFLALTTKEKIKASIVFIIVSVSWFIPVAKAVGFTDYFIQSFASAKTGLVSQSVANHSEAMLKGFLLSFGISGGFLTYYLIQYKQIKKIAIKQKRVFIFWACWIVPGFLYNLFFRSDAVGYQFSYLTAFLFLISYAIWRWTKRSKFLYFAALVCIALFNLYWFFYDRDPTFTKPYRPVSYHYSELRKNDIKTGGKVRFVEQHFDPQKTLIITNEVMWRPYSYYLKKYPFIVLSRLDNKEIPNSYDRIESINWNMKWYKEKGFKVKIPEHINTVVFMDDRSATWTKINTKKIYKLPGNSTITVISVKPNDELSYDYHTIYIKK
jgi:hypothetical protein